MNRLNLFLLLGMIAFTVSCKKDLTLSGCEKLKLDMAANQVEGVKKLINQVIDQLPSKQYTEANLGTLSSQLKNQCSLSAKVLCFDCIKTLPSQTEIEISFSVQGNTIRKIIDITYSRNNHMTFGNIHD